MTDAGTCRGETWMPEGRGDVPPLLLIRHAETQWNREGRLQGRRDTPLTLDGIRQALAVAVATADRHSRHERLRYWVSPLGRARQTASLIADCWGIPFSRFEDAPALVERAYGSWEGKTLAEIERDLPDEHLAHRDDPWHFRPADGESRVELFRRIATWLATLERSHAHVIVTHSGCFRAIRAICRGASRAEAAAYREPQTTAFELADGCETEIALPPSIGLALGLSGEARTVAI